jgi:hypothetical protein
MIRKVNAGNFVLTTNLEHGEPVYEFKETNFNLVKFTKRKIEKAPKGYYIKIEQRWKNGRTKSDFFDFDKFREKYLVQHTPIFIEPGASLVITLGLFDGDMFMAVSNNSIFSFPGNGGTNYAAFKDFMVRLYFDLYQF